ncbi:MAG: glycosyltransferase family 4 protein [Blastocatellia bacterium]
MSFDIWHLPLPVDVAHLSFRPPFAPGSYNRLVGMQLEHITDLRQKAICYWDQPIPNDTKINDSLTLVDARGLSLRQKALLNLPVKMLMRRFNNITDRKSLIYLWQILKILPEIKPRVIVCYDTYKFGPLLRRAIDWPCRLVFSQHGLSYHLSSNEAGRLYSLESFDAVWALTRSSYQFERYRVSAYEPLVKVLPNWINVEEFKPASEPVKKELRARWGLPEDSLVVLWLSRLVPKKGAHAVLESWLKIKREIPNAFLWIVGGGNQKYESYLKGIVKNLAVEDSVRIQGAVAPEQTVFCYQASDLYVFPTLFSGEGFGLSLLEAMACGLPCVASDHVILQELYPDDVVSLAPDANIAGAFVEPVVKLLRDAKSRSWMGNAARAFVEENFNHQKALREVKEFYCEQIHLAGGLAGGAR